MGSKLEARREAGDELDEALATGDHALAIELLVMRYGDYIYGYCRRLLGNTAEAEDVSQIVFAQAFQDLARLASGEAVQAWLRGIARHRCLDRLRARRRDFQLIERDDPAQLGSPPAEDDPRIARALDECLGCLDARSREVLVLRFHDGLSFDEISKLTSDAPGALRVRLSRALPALRRCLERKGVQP